MRTSTLIRIFYALKSVSDRDKRKKQQLLLQQQKQLKQEEEKSKKLSRVKLKDRETIEGETFRSLAIPHAKEYEECTFENIKAKPLMLYDTRVADTTLENIETPLVFTNVRFNDGFIKRVKARCQFINCTFMATEFTGCDFYGSEFAGCQFLQVSSRAVKWTSCKFTNCIIAESKFQYDNFTGAIHSFLANKNLFFKCIGMDEEFMESFSNASDQNEFKN